MIAKTTLNRIRRKHPCGTGWNKLLRSLGKTEPDDEPLSLLYILESNGLDDAIWALCTVEELPEVRLFAVRCVRQEQHSLTDLRSLNVLHVTELYAIGEASDEELDVAESEAWCVPECEEQFLVETAAFTARGAARTVARNVARAKVNPYGCVAFGDEWSKEWRIARAEQEKDFRDIFCTEDKHS